jgi:T4-like virus tail tube protein gp19
MANVKPGENYITTNRFYVEMGGEIKASFTECSGISVQVEKDVYLEGGVNNQQRIFLKQSKFQDITLKRGMTDDLSFWDWVESVIGLTNHASGNLDSALGLVKRRVGNSVKSVTRLSNRIAENPVDSVMGLMKGGAGSPRRNLTILLFNQAGETIQSWKLIGAVPVGWKTPNLQASGNGVAIEELTLAYEGLEVERNPSGNSGSDSNTWRDRSGYFT